MNYQYEIKNSDRKIRITVDVSYTYTEFIYRLCNVEILQKGKRKWMSVTYPIRDCHKYRALDRDGRSEYVKQEILKYCSEDDIKNAFIYAYSQISPDLCKVEYCVF